MQPTVHQASNLDDLCAVIVGNSTNVFQHVMHHMMMPRWETKWLVHVVGTSASTPTQILDYSIYNMAL